MLLPSLTEMVKLPSISVIVPLVELPASTTVAPITGKLSVADNTVPLTVKSCACITMHIIKKYARKNFLPMLFIRIIK